MRRCINRVLLTALLILLPHPAAYAEENFHQTLIQDGRRLELDISAQYDPETREQLQVWLSFIAESLLQVYGHWPRQRWHISVAPAPAVGRDPIPWAQVHRNDVDRVEFYTAAKTTSDTLIQAWTGYHELAHLLIPYRGWGDLWFSEGMASYYQNILMARAGILTEQQMWQKLYEGFLRGRADTRFEGQSLSDVSANVRTAGGFMRVYWSGAWYFLASDVKLRRQSQGKLSLDSALGALNQCCADEHLSVPQIVDRLDELNQVLLFRSLYENVKISTEVPAFDNIFASLGISINDEQVVLQQEGPGARLRRQITQSLAL